MDCILKARKAFCTLRQHLPACRLMLSRTVAPPFPKVQFFLHTVHRVSHFA